MFCKKCGFELLDTAAFCPKCGEAQTVVENNIPAPVAAPVAPVAAPVEAVPVAPAVAPAEAAPVAPVAAPAEGQIPAPQDPGVIQNTAANQPYTTVQYQPGYTQTPVTDTAAQSSIAAYNEGVQKKKKKPTAVIVAIVAVVAILFGIIGSVVSSQQKQAAIDEYYATAEEFRAKCLSVGSDLEDVGNDIQTYWSKYIYTSGTRVYYNGHYMYSIDDAVGYALSDNSATVSSIKTGWATIQTLYNELKTVPVSGDSELERIRNDVEAVYDAFEEMYDCIINVSGNYTTYKSEFGRCNSALADALKDLKTTLE